MPLLRYLISSYLLLVTLPTLAGTIRGTVVDAATGEQLIGAVVRVEQTSVNAVSELDGSFHLRNVPEGNHQLVVSYISYKTSRRAVLLTGAETLTLMIALEADEKQTLSEVVVTQKRDGYSDNTARTMERNALQITNIVSGRAIELSPDLTVANVIQRVSGISVERNSNGDGQYAIVRGMDKRYNYTLVNGVKIPSPDNRYRYVPLDIFPSELLERLEVCKALIPSQEGDAIGGVVNMVMRDAPSQRYAQANLATGYSGLFFNRDFTRFDTRNIADQSPYERSGNQYSATPGDFNRASATYTTGRPAPNLLGGFAIGNRFFGQRLGVMLAGSYQNTYRGSNSLFADGDVSDTLRGIALTKQSERLYSEQQTRYGLHAKLDFRLNSRTKLQWYNAYINLTNAQIRDTKTTELAIGGYNSALGNASLTYATRSRLTQQAILASIWQGTHKLTADLSVNWSAVLARATNAQPDQTSIPLLGVRKAFVDSRLTVNDGYRRWEHNTDQDLAGYVNVTWNRPVASLPVEWMVGGLFRNKTRTNFYNNYTVRPANVFAQYGVDFTAYNQINWLIQNSLGSVASALNYDASEQTAAGYWQFRTTGRPLELVGGLRIEHTDQGYTMKFPVGEDFPVGKQVYTDLLPSLHARLQRGNANWRASYFRSLNRPGFFEIVPYRITNEEYQERGNPNLKRAIADNIDLRYELFPRPLEQFMVGLFYKHIQDPIEYTLQKDAVRGQDIYYAPGNFGTARNYGLEIDAIKYVRKWGLKANYTYTQSSITTPKSKRIRNATGDLETITVSQTRPLYGQSAHVGNLSLLYKDSDAGFDVQVAASYTGERISTVAQFVDNDLWQKAFVQMDASFEKRLGRPVADGGGAGGFILFAKANNLLNTPTEIFIKNTNPKNADVPDQNLASGQTLIRRDFYQQSYLLGLRYKL